ncbi:UDP-glycosyltransferase 85A3 [Forsythia ovata]|uniref:Glycosyltransferase n=1 Tax=Forsythia ovata TaxID=205694 RepID=A0ABD1WJ29_9LAMI
MGSHEDTASEKPHAVCIPFPAQGHINPMLKLAILLNHKGFKITFVNTEHSHKRLLKSRGLNSLDSPLTDFHFKTIPDGLPPIDDNAMHQIPSLCESTQKNCLAPLRLLLEQLNSTSTATASSTSKVTCVVSDAIMTFAIEAAQEIGVPCALLRTTSATNLMCYLHIPRLTEMGICPLKDENCLTNGYLNTIIDWVPGLIHLRLGDFPTFIRATDLNDIMLNFITTESKRALTASAIILNTYDALENQVLNAMSSLCPPLYPVGPLQLLTNGRKVELFGSSLWKEEPECLDWLSTKDSGSVIYVNFGSIACMNNQQFIELAWGLCNSGKNFLWIIREDLVAGAAAVLPRQFKEETEGRGFLAGWCDQEKVLNHPSVGGFLTHCGWNSIGDSLSSGVPIICWPFFGDQFLNCRYACSVWGIGMEIGNNVNRDEVESVVRELMDGVKGKEMKKRAKEWKERAEEAFGVGGSSWMNLDKLVKEVLLFKENNRK